MNGTRVDFYEFVSHRDSLYVAEHYRARAKLDPIHWRVNCYLGGHARNKPRNLRALVLSTRRAGGELNRCGFLFADRTEAVE
jgi:hypothetical protein